MDNIIVAFSDLKTADKIKQCLNQHNLHVGNICISSGQVLEAAYSNQSGGVIVCGFRLTDIASSDLAGMIPESYELVILASSQQAELLYDSGIACLILPVNRMDLVSTVNMLLNTKKNIIHKKKPNRTAQEQKIIDMAKKLLMDRNNMTEDEAHRFIQKKSMNSGSKMADIAKIILDGDL